MMPACRARWKNATRKCDAGLFGHLLAAARGEASAPAPASYVRETCAAFAPGFEHRPFGDLDYRVPQGIADLVRGHAAALVANRGAARLDVFDLGCCTGLVGDAPGGLAASMVGVDLSPRTLEAARKKGGYAHLHEADIVAWLAAAPAAQFDLVVGADVFVHSGDLIGVFRDTVRALRRRGMIAFSIESLIPRCLRRGTDVGESKGS